MHINDGVTYYRHIMATKYLSRMGWKFQMGPYDHGKSDWVGHTVEQYDPICRSSDILITQRNDIHVYIANGEIIQAAYKLPWVYDTDDNVHAIRPTNMGFKSYNPSTPNQQWAIMALEKAFALTVSTEELKRVYEKINSRIYVLPNGVDFELWDTFKRAKRNDGEIRIALVLSGSHFEDMKMIEDVVLEIIKAYPEVRFYIMDAYKGDYLKKLPKKHKHQVVWTKWVDPKDWIKTNKEWAFDIGLAPLTDNDFNRSKSNLRLLEYGAQGVATIASPVEPYKPICEAGLVKVAKNEAEWWDALVELIENPDKRIHYATALESHVRENFDMKDLAKLYDKTYREIIAEFREIYGEPHRSSKFIGSLKHLDTAFRAVSESIVKQNRRGAKRR